MISHVCNKCELEVRRFKLLKRLKGKKYCRSCYQEIRKNHRKETIKQQGIKEELKELDRKISREWAANNRKIKGPRIPINTQPPMIRGYKKNRNPSNSFLTIQEKQSLFRILINRGIGGEQAKKRIKELIKEQSKIRKLMKEEKKSEQQIKIKQQEFLEELWNY